MLYNKRILDALEKLPKAPEGAEEFIMSLYPNEVKKNYLVYKSKKPKETVSCYCTHCNTEFHLPYVEANCSCSRGFYNLPKHFGFEHPNFNDLVFSKQSILCPVCAESVKALHISDVGKDGYIDFKTLFVKVHVIDGMIFVIRWEYTRLLRQDGTFFVEFNPIDGTVYCKQFRAYITKSLYVSNGYSNRFEYYYKWFVNVKFKITYAITAKNIMPVSEEELLSSDFPNCKLDYYIRNTSENCSCYLQHYLNVYRRYPFVENLVMSGAVCFLNSVFRLRNSLTGFCEFVNVKEKRPCFMLGLNKDEYEILVNKLGLDCKSIKFYSENKSDFPLLEFVHYGADVEVRYLCRLKNYPYGFLKPLRYIERQEERLQKPLFMSLLFDYWDMMKNLNPTDFNPFPKNIEAAHDKASKAILALKNKLMLAQYQARARELSKYNFEYEDLIIFPCPSDDELYKEGECLDHCVYGYADRYVNGSTALFFIRKKDKPDVPFYTLEFDEEKCLIRQNHGYRNELYNDKDPGVIEFEKVWLDFAKKVKEKKNGKKRNNSRSRKSVVGA